MGTLCYIRLVGVLLAIAAICGCSKSPPSTLPAPALAGPAPAAPPHLAQQAQRPPVVWSAVADGGPASAELSARFPLELGKEGGQLSFPRAWPALAYLHQGKRAELFDLQTSKSLGAVQDAEPLPNRPAVSPDGKRMATKLLKPGEHIRAWSFETGRVAGDRMLHPDKQFGLVTQLLFATGDRLVAIRRGGGGQAVVMDLAQATQPRTFPLASADQHATVVDGCVGISPGGKYLAALVGRRLVLHDLESGACQGTSDLPAGVPDGHVDGKEIIFSPDGQYLATLLTPPGAEPAQLLEWEAATGQLTHHKRWNSQEWVRQSQYVTAHDDHPLAYLPDGSGLVLYGRLLWKRDADAPAVAFVSEGDTRPRCLLDGEHVVTPASAGLMLQLVARAGATPTPAPLAPQVATDWPAQPDGIASPEIAPQPLAIFGNVPAAPRFSQRPGSFAAASLGKEYVIFHLATGKEAKRFSPPTGQILPIRDLSPDGRFLAVAGSSEGGSWKFQVWNILTGDLACAATEDVGSGEESLEFLNPQQLLVLHNVEGTGQRRAAIWDFAEQRRIQEHVLPRAGSYLSGSQLVTPGGKWLLQAYQEMVAIYDLRSGELLGKAPLPLAAGRTLPQQSLAAGLTLDGTKAYWLIQYQPDTARLFTLELTSGALTARDVDARRLSALAGERLRLHVVPWLPNDKPWLVHRQAVVSVATGEIRGPLDLPPESALLPLAEDKFLLGHRALHLRLSPAVAITPIAIQANATAQLAAQVETLRPKVVAAAPPKAVPSPPPTAPPASLPVPSATEPAPQRRWTATIDPPAKLEPFAPAKHFALPIARNARFIASRRGGSRMVVTDEEAETAQVLDLATGKPVGEPFSFPRRTEEAAISPDGAYVAFAPEDNEITIRQVESGKSATIKCSGSFVECHYLGFARDNQVVAAIEADHRTDINVWDPAGGEPVKRIAPASARDDWSVRSTGLALSPSGRYLAALRYNGLTIYDLDGPSDGQETVVPFANKKGQNVVFRCEGLCFSPDGKRLAATYLQGQFDNVTIWDLETGEPLVFRPSRQHTYLRTITHNDLGPKLCWFPDGETLLYSGTMLLDAATGCPYWVIGQRDWDSLLPLTSQSVLVLETEQAARRLASASLPKDISLARKAVRSSLAINAPPLISAERKSAPPASEKLAGPPTVDGLDASLAAGPIRLASDMQDLRPNHLAVAPAGILAVEQIVDYIGSARPVVTAGPLTPEREVLLETYNLASGKRLHRLEAPERTTLLDVSPDGSLLLTGDELPGSGGYCRLDVWAPKLGKHAVGWRPLPGETDFHDVVTGAHFVDKKRVLVLGAGRLVCWELPECREVYALATDAQPCFSPNRTQFVELRTGKIHAALTGQPVGQLEPPADRSSLRLLDAAYSADGKQIVGVAAREMSYSVIRWDAVTGKVRSEFEIPPYQFWRLSLVGERGVLLLNHPSLAGHGAALIDLEQQQVAALQDSSGIHVAGVGGIYWRTEFALVDKKGAYFAQGFRAGDFAWPTLTFPPPYAVTAPGTKVALQFQSDLPESAKLKAMFEQKLKAAGLVIDSAAATKAVFTASQDRTVVQRAPVEVAIPMIVVRMAILDASGAVAWEQSDRRRHDKAAPFDVVKWLEPRPIPRYLFKSDWQTQIPQRESPRVNAGAG